MLVYKFGGASVKSGEGVKNLFEIVKNVNQNLVLVVSAMGKTTNSLEEVVKSYFNSDEGWKEKLNLVKKYHFGIIEELFGKDSQDIKTELEIVFNHLETKLQEPASLNYDFEYDQVVSYGEILSTKIVSSYLLFAGFKNKWLDVRTFFKTDNHYREAHIDWELSTKLARKIFDFGNCKAYVVQGFIGSTSENFFTTLGREGSDYTASILSYMLDAEKMVVWKDVPGILNADPRLFPSAQKLPEISYLEAIEMTYYGAQVIHPKTMKPLQNKNIPLYVKSFIEPHLEGSVIHSIDHTLQLVPVIIIKKDQVLISISPTDFSFIAEHNLSDIFALFAKYRLKVNLSQNSALSFSVCTDAMEDKYLEVIEILKQNYKVLYNENAELITIRYYTDEVIAQLTGQRKILVEQKSRKTARFVVL